MPSDDTITLSGTPTQTSGGARVNTVIPRRLGHVSLIRELGQGGMGTVWLARDEMLGRDVAVKFLLNAVTDADDPGFARFLEGARAAATLRHPGLTAIHAAELINGVPYQVMEFVDGPTVAAVLERHGPLEPSVAHAIIDAVADAIGVLHERGIVHRDIKPSNVLLDAEGHVFVTDFGLTCRRATSDAKVQVAGTPVYMAPEMFDGTISQKSDVYALGVMLYEMLTGERPFKGNLANTAERAEREALPREPLAKRRVSDPLIEVIERAVHVNPLFRHKSAATFRHAVDEAMGSRPDGVRDGRAIAALVARVESQSEATPAAAKTPGESTPTYFDSLAQIAARKRGGGSSSAAAEKATSRPATQPIKTSESVGHLAAAVMSLHAGRRLPDNHCIPCVSCGYDVRGQAIVGRCPECGMAIVESALPDRLVFCDIDWLRKVVLGLAMVRFSVVAVAAIFAAFIVAISLNYLPTDEMMRWVGLACLIIAVAGPAVGVWLSTVPDPGRPIGSGDLWEVWAPRGAILFVGPFLWLVPQAVMSGALIGRLIVSLVVGVVLMAGMIGFGRVIARCVGRIPDAIQSRRMRADSIQIAMLLGAAPAMILLRAYLGFVAPVVMILLLISMIWFLRRLGACERALRNVVHLSRVDS